MTTYRRLPKLITRIATGLFAAGLAHGALASAPTYLGEYCWAVQSPEGDPILFRAGVTHEGGNHYAFNGALFDANGNLGQVTNGNAVTVNNGLYLYLVSGGADSPPDDGGWHWSITGQLNLSTLSGSWQLFEMVTAPDGNTRAARYDSPMSLTPC